MLDDFADRRTTAPHRVWLTWSAPLAVMAGLAWFLSSWHRDVPRYSPHAKVSYQVDQIDWRTVREAFTSPAGPTIKPQTRRDILRLLGRTMRRTDESTVDWDRLVQQVERTGYLRPLDDSEREQLAAMAAELLFVDIGVRRLEIVALQPQASHEFIAYVRVWAADRYRSMQWWLYRDGQQWKWYDWRDLGSRRQLSEELAVAWAYADEAAWQSALLGGSWNQSGGPSLVLVRDHWDQGRRWSAVEKLRRAEGLPVHPFLEDPYRVELARHWVAMRRFADARRLLQSIDKPREVPDAALLTAACDAGQGRWSQASAALDDYEDRLGPTPPSCRLRLEIAEKTGDSAMALHSCRQWVAVEPGGITPLLELCRLAHDEPGELAAAFRTGGRSHRVWERAVQEALDEDRRECWENLYRTGRSLGLQSAWLAGLEAALAEQRGDWDQAINATKRALHAARPADRRRWNRSLIRRLIAGDQWERLLHDPLAPAFALWTLLSTVSPETAARNPGRILALCEQHRNQLGDSMWANLLVADAAAIEKNWQRAVIEYQMAFLDPQARRNGRARHQWLETCYQLEGPLLAYHRSLSRTEAFPVIGDRLVQQGDWQALAALLVANRDDLPRLPPVVRCWHDFFQAHLLIRQGEYDQAEQLLVRAIRRSERVTMGWWVIEAAVPLLIEQSLQTETWRELTVDSTIGGRFWRNWIAILKEKAADEPPPPISVEQFLNVFAELHGSESAVLYYRAELAAESGDYARVRRLLEPWPEKTMLLLSEDRERQCRRWLVQALMAQEDWESLRQLAERADGVGDREPLLWWSVACEPGRPFSQWWPTLTQAQQRELAPPIAMLDTFRWWLQMPR